ncbi:MAG: sulfur carrier protein ThiS adenylyltransferase ThiF [Eubacteriales bacterium]|nr:sulfur carrier protein ThiS adenylyltransferase ThiF [Eubacteriales bacterium]
MDCDSSRTGAEKHTDRDGFMAALAQRHGWENQEKLSRSVVGIAGLGGLGSHIAVSLARLGIGRLVLADYDRVDMTNLHRQQYAFHQVGMEKPKALAEELRRINPFSVYETHFTSVTPENVETLFGRCQVVCEAFDQPEEKAMLTETVLTVLDGIPLVAASGMAGMDSGNKIRTERVMKNFYLCGDGVSDVSLSGSLTEPRVALCAAHQALMVLRLLLGNEEP